MSHEQLWQTATGHVTYPPDVQRFAELVAQVERKRMLDEITKRWPEWHGVRQVLQGVLSD